MLFRSRKLPEERRIAENNLQTTQIPDFSAILNEFPEIKGINASLLSLTLTATF